MKRLRIRHYWRHGSLWILGPLLVGLAAVGFAYGSEHVHHLNHLLFATTPLAAFLVIGSTAAYLDWRSGIPRSWHAE
jgi:hypothetical protein